MRQIGLPLRSWRAARSLLVPALARGGPAEEGVGKGRGSRGGRGSTAAVETVASAHLAPSKALGGITAYQSDIAGVTMTTPEQRALALARDAKGEIDEEKFERELKLKIAKRNRQLRSNARATSRAMEGWPMARSQEESLILACDG